jgi:hypothetical protein
MLRSEPVVRGSVVESRRRWQEILEPVVAERLPRRHASRAPDVRAAAIVASALSCLETAQDAWADHPHSRLSSLLDHAMAAVAG